VLQLAAQGSLDGSQVLPSVDLCCNMDGEKFANYAKKYLGGEQGGGSGASATPGSGAEGFDRVRPVRWGGICARDIAERFEDMGLREELLRALQAHDFDTPTAMESRCIKPMIRRQDVVVRGGCGRGRTTTIAVAILQHLDLALAECQAIVLTPSDLSASRVGRTIEALGETTTARCHCATADRQHVEGAEGAHIIAGTPRLVLAMIECGALSVGHVETLVMQAFDEAVSAGFSDETDEVIRRCGRATLGKPTKSAGKSMARPEQNLSTASPVDLAGEGPSLDPPPALVLAEELGPAKASAVQAGLSGTGTQDIEEAGHLVRRLS
jgi:hypothetical protein